MSEAVSLALSSDNRAWRSGGPQTDPRSAAPKTDKCLFHNPAANPHQTHLRGAACIGYIATVHHPVRHTRTRTLTLTHKGLTALSASLSLTRPACAVAV